MAPVSISVSADMDSPGPLIGPDGRLYWKQGDLGVNITTRDGKKLYNPMSGVIMRAEPDGRTPRSSPAAAQSAGVRVRRVRQPDQPDNDGDHPGELERLVYVVDGMESGWRINWQFGKYVRSGQQHVQGLDGRVCSSRASRDRPRTSRRRSRRGTRPSRLRLQSRHRARDAWRATSSASVFTGHPARASIQASRSHRRRRLPSRRGQVVVKGLLVHGVKFGPDGALYCADWIEGWDPKDRWTHLEDRRRRGATIRTRTRRAPHRANFKDKLGPDLVALLHHDDMRVRTKAQFELVARPLAPTFSPRRGRRTGRSRAFTASGELATRAKGHRPGRTAGRHAQGRRSEIRAQAAKLIGDLRYAPAAMPSWRSSRPVPRPRFFAAEALGRIQYQPAIAPLIAMLAANNDEDVYLRHAGVTALARIGASAPIVALSSHPSRGVRLAAVVALRRMHDAGVANFLHDRDELVVTEAARAINDDGGIEGALPRSRRCSTARGAAKPRASRDQRQPARWARRMPRTESPRSPLAHREVTRCAPKRSPRSACGRSRRARSVDGSNLGPVQRDTSVARAAIASLVEPVFANGSPALQVALADAIGRLRLTSASTTLFDKVRSAQAASVSRCVAPRVATLKDERTEQALRAALKRSGRHGAHGRAERDSAAQPPRATTADLLASVVGRFGVGTAECTRRTRPDQAARSGREALTRLVDQLVQGKMRRTSSSTWPKQRARPSMRRSSLVWTRSRSRRRSAAPIVAFADALRRWRRAPRRA
jgi:hypothetical protein